MKRIPNSLSAVMIAAGLIVIAAPAPAQQTQDQTQQQGQDNPTLLSDPFALKLQDLLVGYATEKANERRQAERKAMLAFYEGRDFRSLWFSDGAPNERALELLRAFSNAHLHGLRPELYGETELASSVRVSTPAQQPRLELILTQALIDYAGDVRAGLIQEPRKLGGLYHEPNRPDTGNILKGAAGAASFRVYMESLPTQARRYQQLKKGLARYRAIARAGGWARVSEGPTLKPGMTDPRVREVRARLMVTGDLESIGDTPEQYDFDVTKAVQRFQRRHGLVDDGAVGPNTLAALNTPVEQRIKQIIINLERRRWTAEKLGNYYLFVNIADNYLKVVENDETIHVARIVVGKVYHKTPIFSEQMTYVRFNPYWNVPYSIATKEMLPKIKEDPGYLTQRHYMLLTRPRDNDSAVSPHNVDWSEVSRRNFPYYIRQKPGPWNALGTMIFMFPNRHNVFIHDTSNRSVFQRSDRYLSHGCIRVQHPHRLAMLLLKHNEDWSREKLDGLLAQQDQIIVKLERPITVHITYLTAWALRNGEVHFREDVYDRDGELIEAMQRVQGGRTLDLRRAEN